MGHRANFVVIRDSAARAFHDQWAGLGCAFVLEDGPKVAVSEAQKLTPTEELLEWCWAEGGYLIDFDQKVLLAFGSLESDCDLDGEDGANDDIDDESEDMPEVDSALEVRAFLLKIASKWKGWLLRWDDRGVDAFAEHLKSRQIGGIRTQTPSHPPNPLIIEHQA